MIRNDHELAVTRERVASLEKLLEALRKTARPEEWPALTRISHSENETSGRESKKCLRQRYLTDSWRCPDADTV